MKIRKALFVTWLRVLHENSTTIQKQRTLYGMVAVSRRSLQAYSASAGALVSILWVTSVHADARSLRMDAKAFRIIPSESGPTNYFTRLDSPTGEFIRASYEPPMKTAVLGYEMPEDFRQGAKSLSWRWRAVTLPVGGNECVKGKSDSAAVVYVSWRRGLRWYALKYVWSATAPKGAVCEKKSNPFRAQNTVVLESGGPTNHWRSVRIDPSAEFRKHFEDGDPNAAVPDLIGVALMSDGDQTGSKSSADYADFVVTK